MEDLGIPWIKSLAQVLRSEENLEFLEASETVHLLAACFQNLKQATMFKELCVNGPDFYSLVPTALAVCEFPRTIAYFSVLPRALAGQEYRTLTSSPVDCLPYTKGIAILAPSLTYSYAMSEQSKQAIRDAKQCNEHGYHLRDYRPCHADVSRFIAAYDKVEDLSVGGCETFPRLRSCNGCYALFSKHIAPTQFSNLSSLSFNKLYISGGQLRRFIKQHHVTLKQVDCSFVSLTDGSWRSIAQGLIKLPNLQKLHLRSLFQKHEAVATANKLHILSELRGVGLSTWEGGSNINLYPQMFLQHFCTRFFDRKARKSRGAAIIPKITRARYHEVVMHRFPAVVMKSAWMESCDAIERYAGEVFH